MSESSPVTPSKPEAPFLWVLTIFVGFAVLLFAAKTLFGGSGEYLDPRAETRLELKQTVLKEQNELLSKMGLDDKTKREALFASTAESLKKKKVEKSGAVVPGSPTQLKQLSEAAPAEGEAKEEKEAKPEAPAKAPEAESKPAPAAPAAPAKEEAPPAAAPAAPTPAPAAPAPDTATPNTTAPEPAATPAPDA